VSDFEEAKPVSKDRSTLKYIERGQIRVTTYGIYFGPKVYEAIGEPKKIGVSVDRKNRLIRLEPRTAESRMNGWTPGRYMTASQQLHYRLRATRSPLLKEMPIGVYYPIGGGIYAFNEQSNNQ
jgi:hypothetical protein